MIDLTDAFSRGERAYLEDAYIVRDRRGEVLCGRIKGDTQQLYPDGTDIFTSHLVKMLYEDIFLARNGVTYFVSSWRSLGDAVEAD